MKQSEQQALNKFSTRKGDIFWLYHAKLTLVYLYSLQLCNPAVPNVESLTQLFECRFYHSLRGLCCVLWFALKKKKNKMVNSNALHLRSLVSVNCIEMIVQVKILILSSVQLDKHMMAPLSAMFEQIE